MGLHASQALHLVLGREIVPFVEVSLGDVGQGLDEDLGAIQSLGALERRDAYLLSILSKLDPDLEQSLDVVRRECHRHYEDVAVPFLACAAHQERAAEQEGGTRRERLSVTARHARVAPLPLSPHEHHVAPRRFAARAELYSAGDG